MTVLTIERRFAYPQSLVFDMVADVARYPSFAPGWAAARVTPLSDTEYRTDQVIHWSILRLRFQSHTTLEPLARIHVVSNAPPFERFDLTWQFEETAEGGCHVRLDVAVETKRHRMEKILTQALPLGLERLVHAFEAEAKQRS